MSSSRNEANNGLQEASLHAAELRKFMRILDLPVSRTDTVDKLHYKIVDSTVGYKLRSTAIRGPRNHDSPSSTDAREANLDGDDSDTTQ